jgi:hypothetical protein
MKIVEFLRQQGSLLAFVVPGEGVESGKCYPYDVLDILSGRGMWLAVSNIVTYRGLRVSCERASSWCTSPMSILMPCFDRSKAFNLSAFHYQSARNMRFWIIP